MKTLLRTQIEHDVAQLEQRVRAFIHQLSDLMQIDILNQNGQFRFFRRLLNYDDWRIAGTPKSTQFLDYQTVNSDIEAERDYLRVGYYFRARINDEGSHWRDTASGAGRSLEISRAVSMS